MKQARVVEVVIYQTKMGIKDQEHLKKSESISHVLSKFNGFVARQFSRTADGKYIDLVYWTDLSSAEKAANIVKTIPQCQMFFADIESKSIEFMHSNILCHYPWNLEFNK